MTAVSLGDRESVVLPAAILASLAALTIGVLADATLLATAAALVAGATFAIVHRWIVRWDVLLGVLILIILFIPIRRFVLPGNLPFQLEPYRVFVALLVAAWGTSLLIDPRVRLRRSGVEGPLLLFITAAVTSIVVNLRWIGTEKLDTNALKALTFLLSFVLVFYIVVSVVQEIKHLTALVGVLVLGGAVVAVFSIIESRSGWNAFNGLPRLIPILAENYIPDVPARGARLRATGPAEHAIALSAALALLVPLGAVLAMRVHRAWWIPTGLLVAGTLAAVSRTGVVMLAVAALVFLWLRPQTRRLWPLLLPLIAAVHFVLPGTLGTLKYSFFPESGLLNEQRVVSGGGQPGGGRLADISPSLDEWSKRPLLGQGIGTRITSYNPRTRQPTNAIILDNQWLATLLEMGAVGVAAWLWLVVRLVRRMSRAARHDDSQRGWLLVAITASLVSYAVAMFLYDAFSFVQVTFLLYIVMAFGAVLVAPTSAARPVMPARA